MFDADDFSGFNEDAFWGQYEYFKQKSPVPARFDLYRTVFDKCVQSKDC